jgi:hypothetical protein
MRGHGFCAVGVMIASGLLVIAAAAVRARAPQSTQPRTLDATRPITYFIAEGNAKTGFRPGDRQLARWALEAWQRSSAKRLRFEAASESTALVRLYWAEPNGGQYGEMRALVVGGQLGAALYIRPDVELLGEEIARRARGDALLRDGIVYLTCLHELGHALGLVHTREFRDIMYSFGYGGDVVRYFDRYRVQLRARNDIVAVSGLSEADMTRLRELYPAN